MYLALYFLKTFGINMEVLLIYCKYPAIIGSCSTSLVAENELKKRNENAMKEGFPYCKGFLTNQKFPLNTNTLFGQPSCGNPKTTLAAFDHWIGPVL